MSHDCQCTRPIQDTAVVCPHCAFTLDAALAEIVEYLAAELDVTLTKQARVAVGHTMPQPEEPQAKAPGTLKPHPLPYHGGASAAAGHLKAVLVSWARLIHTEAGADLPGRDTLAAIAVWMRPRVGWLRYHDAGQDAVDEITDAVDRARRVIDRPTESLLAGPCDECQAGLYARPGAVYVTCRTPECGQVYEVAARRRWLLESLDDHLANATQMSRLLTYLDIKLADSSIRMYASKGRIVAHGKDVKGRPRYRLGEVVRTYYNAGQRAS